MPTLRTIFPGRGRRDCDTFRAVPAVVRGGGCGAVDVATVVRGKTILQSAVDAAALAGATQMGFDQSQATTERTIRLAAAANGSLGPELEGHTTAHADIASGTMTVPSTPSKPPISAG